ncbi:hypothetical protein AWZ03_008315 [Drosophila navojoa]|uniref:Uncharacterized protein n=1 Tax=Drosophila navojoa TaxID=7232 RepID=A0A484B8Y3_DRONA|nr:UPF0389 protein GA21628 [Drosophila navojoa]TDG45253.1 hypothetical protein AWZ03_008315 [Drosophila navojoa]
MLTKSVLIAALGKRASSLLMQRTFSNTQNLRQSIKNHQPNGLEKRLLVWNGKYKSVDEVPAFVGQEEMERCRNKMRIRLANIMIGLTVVGCGIMIYSGKQAAKRGESVTKQNLEWHKQFNEQASGATQAK